MKGGSRQIQEGEREKDSTWRFELESEQSQNNAKAKTIFVVMQLVLFCWGNNVNNWNTSAARSEVYALRYDEFRFNDICEPFFAESRLAWSMNKSIRFKHVVHLHWVALKQNQVLRFDTRTAAILGVNKSNVI